MNHRRIAWCAILAIVAAGCGGEHRGPGEVTGAKVPQKVVDARAARQQDASGRLIQDVSTRPTKQVLFGDLHVHTTFSADAFLRSLPMLQGEGAHPPADACDFARFCSDLDFWAITDHAETISPRHWRETKESIRQCNAVSGDEEDPDVVAFLGWEWTQVGTVPADHYGHKNVILLDTAEDSVPTRPISALNPRLAGALRAPLPFWSRISLPLLDFANRQAYFDLGVYLEELRALSDCPKGVDTRELSDDCHESAETPRELFEKLSQWGFDSIVIPHGTTWGFYTPPGSSLDKQLAQAQNDPEKQSLFEVYSGHGNSEEHRAWRAVTYDADGKAVCPAPSKDYTPCCWRAGEIVRSRCGDSSADECEGRVAAARQNYLAAGVAGHLTVPGTPAEDWLDCGQCRDCFNPSFNYRPGGSAQYALAIGNFDDPGSPLHFRFGFMASSDNHTARPGTGYKEYERRKMTEASGARDATWRARIAPPTEPTAESQPFDLDDTTLAGFRILETERQASFFMTGGLVAVHAERRNRNSIWQALKAREVYGTSGDRILLWFDLLNGPDGSLAMGSEVALTSNPRFEVRAIGALAQKPGCPESSTNALAPDRLESLCRGECYNPADERRVIERIEIVRVVRQASANEPIAPLIEDPWRRFDCAPDPAGCSVAFEDPDFAAAGRDVAYYARAVQERTPAVNAAGLRCEYDDDGNCVRVHPCFGDHRTPFDDDCLAENRERAWSSPIFLLAAQP